MEETLLNAAATRIFKTRSISTNWNISYKCAIPPTATGSARGFLASLQAGLAHAAAVRRRISLHNWLLFKPGWKLTARSKQFAPRIRPGGKPE